MSISNAALDICNTAIKTCIKYKSRNRVFLHNQSSLTPRFFFSFSFNLRWEFIEQKGLAYMKYRDNFVQNMTCGVKLNTTKGVKELNYHM